MKKTIKLLLLAALAWPGIAMAQGQVTLPRHIEHDVLSGLPLDGNLKSAANVSSEKKVLSNQFSDRMNGPARAISAESSGVYEQNVNFTVTVCRGSQTNQYVPAYGYYFESAQEGQMIYPASLVGLSKGDKISSITFYTNSNFRASNQVTLRIGETADTVISAGTYATTGRTLKLLLRNDALWYK